MGLHSGVQVFQVLLGVCEQNQQSQLHTDKQSKRGSSGAKIINLFHVQKVTKSKRFSHKIIIRT